MFVSAKGRQQKQLRQLQCQKLVLIISHNTFWGCHVHIFSDNVFRNSVFTRSAGEFSCAASDFSQVFCPRSVIPRLIPKLPATIEITPLVTYYQFLRGALARAKCTQRSTMGNKIWLSMHQRIFFFGDKIVRTFVHPFMLAGVKCQTYQFRVQFLQKDFSQSILLATRALLLALVKSIDRKSSIKLPSQINPSL